MRLFVNGEPIEFASTDVEIEPLFDRLVVKTNEGTATALVVRSGDAVLVSYRGQQYRIERTRPRSTAKVAAANGEIRAPMPGQIVEVLLAEGSEVVKGDKILVLEAMKTQQAFTAPFDGRVTKLAVVKGAQVVDGALLAVVMPSEVS